MHRKPRFGFQGSRNQNTQPTYRKQRNSVHADVRCCAIVGARPAKLTLPGGICWRWRVHGALRICALLETVDGKRREGGQLQETRKGESGRSGRALFVSHFDRAEQGKHDREHL